MPLFCLVQCVRWIAMEEKNKAKQKGHKWVNKWLLERENKESYGGFFSELCSEDKNFKDSSFNISNVAWKQFLFHSCSSMKVILRSIEQDVPGRAVSENISHPVSTPLSQTYLLNDSWTATGWNHTLQCATEVNALNMLGNRYHPACAPLYVHFARLRPLRGGAIANVVGKRGDQP